ncbi:SUMF1/EgtB/PvdO family nonheme iron enzyme [Nostoc sp. FACHB-892]|uniref:caspase, EACC1-associated type n=1 Tax=Nostoc sp. FACHB-892 TaxID=2692843 RepID=UPI00168695C5|nr:SUMF1/EgtB/PvdO family nonheme iron enzyme [Nostoc sp. FACHB-892]MBD2728991.1 SUMF1/EgtB/PvdO family nonheme iron enzyme [Nostoc sp. FACHB-892]
MTKFALLIGVSEYDYQDKDLKLLPAAVKDVDAMRRVLVNPEMGDFPESNITVLKNPQPQAVREAIFNLFFNRQKHDLLLFYFSGHGIKDEKGQLYLSTRETKKQNSKLVTPSAVPASVLHENINDSRSLQQVIILDCCFSGAITQGMTVKSDGTVNVQEQLGGKGRAILTSSTSAQYSFEQEGSELSIYTRYLVEGIETGAADKDTDGWISIDELHEYASTKVQEAAPAMTPKFYPVEEGHKILLAKSPKDDPKLKYRKEVETRAKKFGNGKFSIFALQMLESKRIDWGLSEDEAKAIREEVLQPYREYERKQVQYEEALTRAVNEEYPFNEEELEEYQQYLGLRDEDITSIKQRVLAPKQAEYERQQELERIRQRERTEYQRQQAELKKQGDRESSKTISVPKSLPDIQTQPFEFETATINIKSGLFGLGKTCEVSRSRKRAEFFSENLGDGVVLEMVKIPGGQFLMGSPESEPERTDWESPQRTVTVQPFFMGKFPITQSQWVIVARLKKVNIDLKTYPSRFKSPSRPVEQVSWDDAVEFCARLSNKTRKIYRLPSEAEWEYACRAGTTTPFYFGETITTDLANYDGKSIYAAGPKGEYRGQTTDVGKFPPNPFGLFDMHGNIFEWCQDSWHENYNGAPKDGGAWMSDNDQRLLHGGCWDLAPRHCRSADRSGYARDIRDGDVGFRVVVAAPLRT